MIGSKSCGGFGPVRETGEPFHMVGQRADSGRKTHPTNFPTPGESVAAAGAFSPTPHKPPTSGINAHELIHANAQCCSPIHAMPTPGPTYSYTHYISTVGNSQNQDFDWRAGYPAQSSSPLRCGRGGFAVAPVGSGGDYQHIRGRWYI